MEGFYIFRYSFIHSFLNLLPGKLQICGQNAGSQPVREMVSVLPRYFCHQILGLFDSTSTYGEPRLLLGSGETVASSVPRGAGFLTPLFWTSSSS